MRFNTLNGESEYIRVALQDTEVLEHIDKNVDIAVLELLPDQNIFDVKFIPSISIANKKLMEQHKIPEGDDVLFAGLFTGHIGQKKNQPIIRFGKVSLISDEKILWQDINKQPIYCDLYLLECQSFGGNSGSPVFFDLHPFRNPGQMVVGGKQIFLAGVMTGSFLQNDEIKQIATTSFVSQQNAGIAAVTPADKLYDILFSDFLVTRRKQWDQNNNI